MLLFTVFTVFYREYIYFILVGTCFTSVVNYHWFIKVHGGFAKNTRQKSVSFILLQD